jgi:hypothetical protein
MITMLSRLLSAVTLALVAVSTAHAGGPFVLEPGKGFAHLYGGALRADQYYNTEGEMRSYDTLKTDFSAVMFGLSADYGLLEGLELNFEMPVGIFTLTSASRFPDRQIVSPTHVGIGATYQLSGGSLATSVSTMLKIPPGFHDGIYDDPNHPTFLSDGYFQLQTMLHAGFTHKNIWLKGAAGYTWRDEEPIDEIPYAFEIGFSRVEGTGIFVGVNGVVSTGDVTQPLRPFYAGASGTVEERQRADGGRGIFRTIDRENNLNIGAGAFVYVMDQVMISGRYELRLFGRNSIATRGAFLGVGYRF